MQYISTQDHINRNPLHYINQNKIQISHQPQQFVPYYVNSQYNCNENMDPSQNQNFIHCKSAANNIQKIENALNEQNLYIRRHANNNQQIPPLKVEIAPNPTTYSTVSSANSSYVVNNEDFVLSSASSLNSSSIQNGYYSRSRSLSEIMPNEKRTKMSVKSRSRSLFKKLSKLVKTRNTGNSNHHHKMQNVDDDGDILIDKVEDEDVYTPSTGNTPRLVTSVTPFASDEYSEEMITAILGNDTFKQDYISELFEEEKRTNSQKWFNPHSGYLKQAHLRKNAIDWICRTGVLFDLQRSSIYAAIYYFDHLCSVKEVNICHLQMIAASCLLVAIKWNEKEERVPSLYRLSKECNKLYSPLSFKPMEIKILNLLNYKLKIVLPVDFVTFYISESDCIFDDDVLNEHTNLHLNEQSKLYLHKFAIFFLDIACQNYKFWKYAPSILAFAVIIASRRALKIEPYFNEQLVDICRYPPSQIINCFDDLWEEYVIKFPDDANKAAELQPHGLDYFVR